MTELLSRGMNRKDVDSFAYGVLADSGFNDWSVDWSKASPGLCIHDTKTILLPIKFLAGQPLWFAFEYALHEIAHIDTFTGDGDGHTPDFFSEYARFVDKYLGKEVTYESNQGMEEERRATRGLSRATQQTREIKGES